MRHLVDLPIHYLQSRTAWSIHSPQLYGFARNVLDRDFRDPRFRAFEQYRQDCLDSGEKVNTTDLKAESTGQPVSRRITDIVSTDLRSPRKCRFLFRVAKWWSPDAILEHGASLGISTAYLAAAGPSVHVHALERERPLLDKADNFWQENGLTRIHPMAGTLQECWPEIPWTSGRRWLIHLNGDRDPDRIRQLLELLSAGVPRPMLVIMNDIRRSEDMRQDWQIWPSLFSGGAWLDLYHTGIWIADPAFREPVVMPVIPSQWKPIRAGWL